MTTNRLRDVYRRLDPIERAFIVYKKEIGELDDDQEAWATCPRHQLPYFKHRVGAIEAIYRVVGVLASHLSLESRNAYLSVQLACTRAWWGRERTDSGLVGGDGAEEGWADEGPSDPRMFLPGLMNDEEPPGDEDLAFLDLLTRTTVSGIEESLAGLWQDMLGLDVVFTELLEEIGAVDLREPSVQAELDRAREALSSAAVLSRGFLGVDTVFPDQPDDATLADYREGIAIVRRQWPGPRMLT